MQRALELAEHGSLEFSAPNPHVGCVIVKEGEVVGEGHSDPAGGAHAEVNALKTAGNRARGATAYVTLEPCNHHGRTGPCSQALLEAGIKEVVFAVGDPNPIAVGGGDYLRAAGISVIEGVLEDNARRVHRQFLYSTKLERPFVTVKAGVSLDGRIALPSGESKWITSAAARRAVQRLRAEKGCVLVGGRTALVDQARLTVREFAMTNPPTRVVIDSHGNLPEKLPVFSSDAPSLRFTPAPAREGDRQWNGVEGLLKTLYVEGHRGLLVEGGAKTIANFLNQNFVDEIELFVAPIILGDGPSWVDGLGLNSLTDSKRFDFAGLREIHADSNQEVDQSNLRITLHSRNLSKFLTSE